MQTLTPPAAISSGSFGFSYGALSRRTQLTRPNGISTNYSYDTLSRLLSVLHQAGASTIDGATYTVDAAGNRTAKTDQRAGVTSSYSYDALYELTQVVQGANTTESYSYDQMGNRLSSLGVSPYNYNVSNELTSTPTATYTYDYNGNATSKTDSTGTTNYTWDFENRLTSVTLPGSGGTVSFKYDPFGRRIYKSSSSGTSIYAYDGANLIEETSSSGAVVARYTQTQSIDQPLAMLRSGATSYYHADGLGSITSLSNGAGALAQTYSFDSFGKQTASSGSLTNSFRYTAREFDTETNLYFYRARYYDVSSGRFLSEDAFRFQAGVDFYKYTGNSPLNFIDPSGYKPCSVDVRCWPIEKFNLGVLGFQHCFVTVVNKDSKCQDISGGPEHGKLHVWDTPAKPHPEATTYYRSLVPCTMVDCMEATVPKINNLNLNYSAIGPNSNNAFATILSACGLADLIQYAPGGAFPLHPLDLNPPEPSYELPIN